MRFTVLTLSVSLLAAMAGAQDGGLTDADAAALRKLIEPDAAETAAEDLPWLTSYHAGLAQAAAETKPLLLWIMNGHPLGCT